MTQNLQDQYPPFEAYQGEDAYIFISYAHRDKKIVYPEIARLNSLRYRIWYDEGITPGSEWSDEIGNALQRCNTFIVFISPQSIASENVRKEIHFAIGEKKLFLAIHIENTQLPPGLKLQMSMNQAILKYNLKEEHYQRKLEQALPTVTFSEKINEILDITSTEKINKIPSQLQSQETIEIFFKMSQENLDKYSLAELLFLNPISDKNLLETLSEDIKINPDQFLFLNHLFQLSFTQVETLTHWKGKALYLNGLQHLDEATAKTLSQWDGRKLYLNGLKQLSEATAKALSQWDGSFLELNGLQELEKGTAKALSQWQGKYLYLNGVKQLDVVTAKALAHWMGYGLYLKGLQQLDEATAKALLPCKQKLFTKQEILTQILTQIRRRK